MTLSSSVTGGKGSTKMSRYIFLGDFFMKLYYRRPATNFMSVHGEGQERISPKMSHGGRWVGLKLDKKRQVLSKWPLNLSRKFVSYEKPICG